MDGTFELFRAHYSKRPAQPLKATRGMAQSLLALLANPAEQVTHLAVAFDCTFVALALSLVLMFFLHAIQRHEETLVLDCQQFCQEHLVLRLYDPQPEHAEV